MSLTVKWQKGAPHFGDREVHRLLITSRYGSIDTINWTDEGGWNTFYFENEIYVQNKIEDRYVAAWSELPDAYKEEEGEA